MSDGMIALTTFTEDEKFFYETVKDFAEGEIKPLREKMDVEGKLDPKILPLLFEMGLMGIEVPEEFGGAGSTFFMSIMGIEALSTVDPAVAVVMDVQNTLVNNAFIRYGCDELKQKYLPLLAEQKVGAYALSEAGSGCDAFALACRAEDKGDHYLLNGQKLWITNAGEAEVFIIIANLKPEEGYKGITAFIVERDFPGFSVSKKEDKLGIRASSTCELLLEDCQVPKENLLGEEGKGYKVAIETLNEGRIGIGAQMIGTARGALDFAIAYTKERQQFGKPIATFQGLQFQIAQAETEVEAARLVVYNAARLKGEGKVFIKEAAMAKLFASQVAQRATSLALELLGGNGFTREYPVEKYFRDAKVGVIYEGTSNMQLQTIAKMVM
ncbi:MAG: acyl-CoA dehydrogenase [Candidatus Delongbacteria bacterium]|nr:acyl-CoA dehydrogenase [Candidatus Delongbacteria bacterium]